MLMFSLNTFCFGIVCTCFGSVHGTWGSWTNWGECTKSCGGGEKVRRRFCTGDLCKEELEKDKANETTICNSQNCLCPDDWGPWHPWKECKPDCQQTRVRLCKNSTTPGCLSVCNGTSDDAQHCYGQPGCLKPVCSDLSGNETAEWSDWGSWTRCSAACNAYGQRSRYRRCEVQGKTRNCTDPVCLGDSEEAENCFTECCVYKKEEWEIWSGWGPCSRTCGLGRRFKGRKCFKPPLKPRGPCESCGIDTRNTSCALDKCEGADACNSKFWGEWTQWTQCLPTCGGEKDSIRMCYPLGCNCSGSGIRKEFCPGDLSGNETAEWSDWGSWTRCSAACNATGQRSRYRTCEVQGKTRNCTDPVCLADSEEAEKCFTECCDYKKEEWEIWSGWGPCSRTCGLGRKFKGRKCFKPPLNPPGACESCGIDTRNTSCAPDMCQGPAACNSKTWGEWSQWTQCLTTCGGLRVSLRMCYPLGCNCSGSGIRKEHCPDAVLVEWSEWTEFGKCTAKCDAQGRMRKTRTCNTLLCTCTGPSDVTVSCKGPACGHEDVHASKARTRVVLGSAIACGILVLLAAVLIATTCYKRRARNRMSQAVESSMSGLDPQQEVNIVLRPAEDTGVGPGGVIPLAPQSYLTGSPSSAGYSEVSSVYSDDSSAYSDDRSDYSDDSSVYSVESSVDPAPLSEAGN